MATPESDQRWLYGKVRLRFRGPGIHTFRRMGGAVRLSGGGVSYGPGLLSPARPSATLEWTAGSAVLSVRTATVRAQDLRSQTQRPARLPAGIVHGLMPVDDEPALADVTAHELAPRIRPIEMTVDGEPRPGRLLDLRREGLGWLAEVDLSDRYRLDLAANGFEPDGLSLVSRA